MIVAVIFCNFIKQFVKNLLMIEFKSCCIFNTVFVTDWDKICPHVKNCWRFLIGEQLSLCGWGYELFSEIS